MSSRPSRIVTPSRLRTVGLATLLAGAIGLVYAALALAAPANDNRINATTITGDTVDVVASNVNATKEPGEPNHAANPGGHSLWWSWTAPQGGVATIDACGSNFDTLVAVYTVRPDDTLHGVRANDDSAGCGDGTQSRLEFTASGGVAYLIAVDGADGAKGQIALSLRQAAINDSFAKAIPLSGKDIHTTGNNRNATSEPGEPIHADPADGASVWYRWVAPGSGLTRVDTCEGFSGDTALGVYQGTAVSNLVDVAGNDEDDTDIEFCEIQARLFFQATQGQVYWIAVDTQDGVPGPFGLWVNLYDDPILNINLSGNGVGRVTSSPKGINCGNGGLSCSHAFDPETVVALTPKPAVDSIFDHWTGDCAGSGPCQLTLSQLFSGAPYTVGAVFAKKIRKPDAQVKLKSDASFLGDGVYNATGNSQTASAPPPRARRAPTSS